jgi:transcriptional regulator with XRE-family HTH domain
MKKKHPPSLDDIARRRIIHWRKAARMTQKQLGELCGKNTVWISRYENEYFNADLNTLRALAEAFNRSIFAALDVRAGDAAELRLVEGFRAIRRPAARAMVMTLVLELSGGGDALASARPAGRAQAPASRAAARGTRRARAQAKSRKTKDGRE